MSKSLLDDIKDDDSESDSDYNPDEEEISIDHEQQKESKIEDLSYSRKRKVDELFNDLQNEDEKFINASKEKSNLFRDDATKKSSNNLPSKSKYHSKEKKKIELLTQLFGKAKAFEMLNKPLSDEYSMIHHESNPITTDVKEQIKRAVESVQKKQKITEVRKFAGQEVKIEKTVISRSDVSSKSNSSKLQSSSALDTVLETLKGPKVVSTVSKSSSDWDNYKEKEKLTDDLAKASKDGYLTKKEFLDRCDYRNFETERDARLKAMTSNITGGSI